MNSPMNGLNVLLKQEVRAGYIRKKEEFWIKNLFLSFVTGDEEEFEFFISAVVPHNSQININSCLEWGNRREDGERSGCLCVSKLPRDVLLCVLTFVSSTSDLETPGD